MIGESMNARILLVLAKKDVDGYVAGAWNCIGSHALFGRNWGKKRDFECKNLHFELCYYQVHHPHNAVPCHLPLKHRQLKRR